MEKLGSLSSKSLVSNERGSSKPAATVSSIFVYPVKSCRGISVSQAPITSTGFRWDRQWMVVNSNGRACTQRVEPRLALVEPQFPPEAFDANWEPSDNSYMDKVRINRQGSVQNPIPLNTQAPALALMPPPTSGDVQYQKGVPSSKQGHYSRKDKGKAVAQSSAVPRVYALSSSAAQVDNSVVTVLQAPGMDSLKIRLNRACNVVDGISVWEWSGSALDEGNVASEWFSKYLGKPCRLVRFNTSSERRSVDPDYASGYTNMFSDGFPYLVISQGSLNLLNELLKEPVPINRFRPNILVDGCEPFSEDLWKVTKLNNMAFHGVKLCGRCKVPSINQESGVLGTEPTETMKKFRTDTALKRGKPSQAKVYFGQNFVCSESLSALTLKGKSVRVGDPIHVLQSYASYADAAA